MLPPDRSWCKSEFFALADVGSVKSQAKPDPPYAQGGEGERRRAKATSGGRGRHRVEGAPETQQAARGERSVNVSLTARVVGDTGIEPVTSSV
jgi:hypothetical protein